MKKFFFLILILAMAGMISAQENSFLVYSLKGNITVNENNADSKVKVGKLLGLNSVLKVNAGGTVTLICNEVAMFTLRKPGTYRMSQLGDSCKVSSSSVSANYVRYVWAQMTKTGHAPGSNRKLYMNTVGAVSRDINNIWIDPRLDTINYVTGDFPLSWKSYSDSKEFEFSLYEAGNTNPVYQNTVSKLKVQIPSFAAKLKPGTSYQWTAAVKGETNNSLKVFNYVSKETLANLVKSFKATGAFENAAEEAYRMAFLLEDAHYLADAYQYYLKAAALAPDVPLYRSTLMSFKKDYEIK